LQFADLLIERTDPGTRQFSRADAVLGRIKRQQLADFLKRAFALAPLGRSGSGIRPRR
jgi:hypothetical protein